MFKTLTNILFYVLKFMFGFFYNKKDSLVLTWSWMSADDMTEYKMVLASCLGLQASFPALAVGNCRSLTYSLLFNLF